MGRRRGHSSLNVGKPRTRWVRGEKEYPNGEGPQLSETSDAKVAKQQENHLWMLAKCRRNLVNGRQRTQQNNVGNSTTCSVMQYGYEQHITKSTPTTDEKRLE